MKNLVEACKISQDMFNLEYDNYKKWGRNKTRGPPGYEKTYYPPLGWYDGYALK